MAKLDIKQQDASAEPLAFMHRLERARRGNLLGTHHDLDVARLDFFHAAIEYDPAAVDEHEIGEHVLDLFHLVRRHYDGAVAIEVVVQQGIVKMLAIQDVEAKRRLVQHQQSRVNGHNQSEVQLRHHTLRQFQDFSGRTDGGLCKKTFRLRAIESRMDAGDVVERLRNANPARQNGDIGNEADIAHELIAFDPGIAPEHSQFSLIRSKAENGIERGSLACAVGTDETENPAFFHA